MKTQNSSLELSHFPVMLSEVIKYFIPTKRRYIYRLYFWRWRLFKGFSKFSKNKSYWIRQRQVRFYNCKGLEKKFKNRFKFYQTKFSQINSIFKDYADVIIFDLGLSSIQLKDLKRGFSFKSKENLDMMMGLSSTSAKEVINNLSEKQLKTIIRVLGEEKEASKIAKNIVIARTEKKITKVDELVKIIEKSKRKKFFQKN